MARSFTCGTRLIVASSLLATWSVPSANVPVEIDSKRNNAFKLLKKLGTRQGRRKLGRFVAEGETFLRLRPRTVFVRRSRWQEGSQFLAPSVLGSREAPAEAAATRPLTWGGGLPMDPGSAMADDTASVAVLRNELFDEISTQETPAAAV
eukprot:g16377.t2